MADIKLLAGITLACLAASSFAAPSPVGSWTGHLVLTVTSSATPQERQGVANYQAMANKSKVKLTVKANHTFTTEISGGQKGTQQGTWTVKGNSVILTNGKGNQPFTMSKDGKSMTSKLPTRTGVSGMIQFTR